MFPLLKKLFTDETAAIGTARFVLLGLGGGIMAGYDQQLGLHLPNWLGVLSMASAGFLRAGEKNAPASPTKPPGM